MRRRWIVAVAAWLIWSPGLSAEEIDLPATSPASPSDTTLDPVVIAGTLIPTEPGRNPGSVTVITKAQIAAMHALTAADLLRQIPGVQIDQAANRGGVSSLYVRGGDPNYTLVLIDGVRVNDPANSRGGSFDFSSLPTDGIERIEIARGVFSSVYGSDAMAGVVNIVTTRGAGEPSGSIELAGGTIDDYRALVEGHGAVGPADYSIIATYLDGGEPVEGSALGSATLQASLGLQPTDRSALRAHLRYGHSRQESFPDDSGGPRYAVIREVDQRYADDVTMGASWSQELSTSQELTLALGYHDRREQLDSPGVAPGIRDPFGIPPNVTNTQSRFYDATLSHRLDAGHGLQVTLGMTAQNEEGKSRGYLATGGPVIPTSFTLQRSLWAAFIEARYQPHPRLTLQAGARVDLPEGVAAQWSPRLALLWIAPATETSLRASWGRGFKLPSFYALGHPIIGNPNLELERSRSVDLSLTQPWLDDRLRITVTAFFNHFFDAIDFDEGPPPMLVNRPEITANGMEADATWQPTETLTLRPQLTYLHTNIVGTTEPLRNRPSWRGGLTGDWRPTPPLALYAALLGVGRIHDSSIPTGDRTLDAYARIDVAATWTAGDRWEIFVALDNLFDVEYEEAVGFPVKGIMARAGLRATL